MKCRIQCRGILSYRRWQLASFIDKICHLYKFILQVSVMLRFHLMQATICYIPRCFYVSLPESNEIYVLTFVRYELVMAMTGKETVQKYTVFYSPTELHYRKCNKPKVFRNRFMKAISDGVK
jgi:hypothetical protein